MRDAYKSAFYSVAVSALSIVDAAFNPHPVAFADQITFLFAFLMALDAVFEAFGGLFTEP